MFKGTKKLVAFATAVVVAAAGFMIDNKNAKAEEQYGDLYYEVTRAENQDNDLEPVGDHYYLYEGQEFVITGVNYEGQKLTFDYDSKDFSTEWESVYVIERDEQGNEISSYQKNYLKNYTPESLEDYLVVGHNSTKIENGKLYSDGLSGITPYIYVPVEKVDSDGKKTGELGYEWSINDTHTEYRYRYYDCEPLYLTDESGSIIPGYYYADAKITKATNTKETFGVRTINSGSSISVTSDNESVAVAKVSGRQFTVETKKIGVANLTISDDAGHSVSFQYMVVNPTAANATEPSNSSDSSSSSGSSSNSGSGSNANTSTTSYVNEIVTVNSAGQTVRTFTSTDGLWRESLISENEVVPSGATFTSKEIEQTGEYYIAINNVFMRYWDGKFGQNSSCTIGKMVEFDLADMSGAAIHQLDGYVTVSMDMPSDVVVGENQILTVYRVAEDGTVVACPTVVENGVIQFSTNHFSTYVFVVSDEVASEANGASSAKSPKTGEQ